MEKEIHAKLGQGEVNCVIRKFSHDHI